MKNKKTYIKFDTKVEKKITFRKENFRRPNQKKLGIRASFGWVLVVGCWGRIGFSTILNCFEFFLYFTRIYYLDLNSKKKNSFPWRVLSIKLDMQWTCAIDSRTFLVLFCSFFSYTHIIRYIR